MEHKYCTSLRARNERGNLLIMRRLPHLSARNEVKYVKISLSKYLVLLIITFGCTHKSDYRKMVDRELAKDIRVDSLFMGLEFGMTRPEFFAHCWELNKQGLFRDGPGNTTVEYETNDLKYPAYVHFYPDFYEGKISEIPVKFKYKAWAPWNKHLFADSLQLDVLELYKKWYGDGFIKVTHPERGTLFVKVDGNRRIIIAKTDDVSVTALYSDLSVEEDRNNNQLSSY